jgi:hypothetical protein
MFGAGRSVIARTSERRPGIPAPGSGRSPETDRVRGGHARGRGHGVVGVCCAGTSDTGRRFADRSRTRPPWAVQGRRAGRPCGGASDGPWASGRPRQWLTTRRGSSPTPPESHKRDKGADLRPAVTLRATASKPAKTAWVVLATPTSAGEGRDGRTCLPHVARRLRLMYRRGETMVCRRR